ncbi:aldo/keto reductase [Flavobacterium nackdongense]|uniref:L-glyceraldehyde 3-phosphate reductase n=1 Tax=Flavobacterium nackdongense TaxID=2547394 RepID=A0A4P6YID7_9FLAO|nr:aldo/keto reductase [Flavobacterium nackdongense]QBN20350.1 L-glyceraldehyde 3-phosphate reductase [Flavobacterium nackdongense]
MEYNRCGKSGLKLPQISLGLWHNFGSVDSFENAESIAKMAFDKGITHFDLANNYGPIPGSAETNFGKILKNNFQGNLRDEIVISTKAGYGMWAGPYGDWGSRKYLLSSLDQSLKRMDLNYVDIFYSHRFDPETPLEETMSALDYAVRSGKALYAGISNYPPEQTAEAAAILKKLGTPCLIHQVKYSMFVRTPEEGLLDVLEEKGIGCIAFSPLAQGLLTDRYLKGIPENSRASNPNGFLKAEDITEEKIKVIVALNDIAQSRNQSLAQMALAWLLKDNRITSVLIGASSVGQLQNNIDALENIDFTKAELDKIEGILAFV